MLSLVGCGGNGGYVPKTFDLDAVQTAYMQQANSYALKAFDGLNHFELDITRSPGLPSKVGSTPAQTMIVTLKLFENGTLIASGTDYQYFVVDRFKFLAIYNPTTGQPTVISQQFNLPHHADLNQTGPLDSATIYTDIGQGTVFGTTTTTWSLLPGGDNVGFCLDQEGTTTDGPVSETDCTLLDAVGDVVGLIVTFKDSQGNSLTFH